MLKTRISRVQHARDHVHAIIYSCDGELRDHEQRPPLILGSAARSSRISTITRARETVLHDVVWNRFDFTGSSNVGQFGIGPGRFVPHNSIRVHARARPRSNEARSTINSACHVELANL